MDRNRLGLDLCGCGTNRRRSSSLNDYESLDKYEERWQRPLRQTLDALQSPIYRYTARDDRFRAGPWSSVSTGCSVNTTDTLLDQMDLLTGSRRSSEEARPVELPKLLIEHISQLEGNENEKSSCIFCPTGKCTHTPSTLSALSGGEHFLYPYLSVKWDFFGFCTHKNL